MKRYRYLRANELVRFRDERFDYEFGWTVLLDNNLGRFSKEYRRVGRKSARLRRFRRKVK